MVITRAWAFGPATIHHPQLDLLLLMADLVENQVFSISIEFFSYKMTSARDLHSIENPTQSTEHVEKTNQKMFFCLFFLKLCSVTNSYWNRREGSFLFRNRTFRKFENWAPDGSQDFVDSELRKWINSDGWWLWKSQGMYWNCSILPNWTSEQERKNKD